jgi:hypothetical protein
MKELWSLPLAYICNARIVSIGDSKHVTGVSTNHLPGYDNTKVLGFYVVDKPVGFLPRNISNFFPNIEGLGLYRMGITELKREDLEPFPKLKAIDLNGNKIEEVSNNLFAGNPLVHSIAFYRNPVRHVSQGVFDHLKDLFSLTFYESTCFNAYVANKTQIPDFILKLTVNCPQTFDMIYERTEAKLLEGVKLEMKIDQQISERVNPLTWSLQQTDERLEEIELRVAQLEKELMNLKMLKMFLSKDRA